MTMLEQGIGGEDNRLEWHGREMFPERLHVIALVIDGTTRLLDTLATFAEETAAQMRTWPSTTEPDDIAATRARLEAITSRYE